MKKHFFTGLIVLLPIVLSLLIFIFIIDLLTKPFVGYIEGAFNLFASTYIDTEKFHHFIVILSRIISLILLFFLILFLGILAKRLFFSYIIKKCNNALLKIPIFNKIFRICHDIINAVFAQKKKLFEKVVLVSFPTLMTKSIGLVTGNAPKAINDKTPLQKLKSVFIPTSPHPFSGLLFLVEEKNLIEIELNIEDTLKFLISCGVFVPERE